MSFATCMKSTCDTVRGYMQSALGYKDSAESAMSQTLGYRNDALEARNTAVAAKDMALLYRDQTQVIKDSIVIPTDATYNTEAIEGMYNDNLTLIVANQAQISYLSHMIKGEYNG